MARSTGPTSWCRVSPSWDKSRQVKPVTVLAVAVVSLSAPACGGGHAQVERHLVFVRGTEPTNATVWVADANGRRRHRLTRGHAAAVAPDGRTIAVGRADGIHLVSSDGKHDRRLTSTNLWPEAWSADGRWIVAVTDYSLRVVDADSGRSRLVARGVLYGFDFSPDGRRLIYGRAPRRGGDDICTARIDLYVVAVGGSQRSRLTHDGRSGFPVWGLARIAFMRLPRRSHFADCFAPGIWTMRADGSQLRARIARAPKQLSHAGYYGLQPVAWLKSGDLLVGVRSEWGEEAAVLKPSGWLRRFVLYSGRGAHRTGQVFYVDKASRDGRLALGSGGNEKTTISIIRLSDGQPIFTLRGAIWGPDWNR
jgi:hypothetical protein